MRQPYFWGPTANSGNSSLTFSTQNQAGNLACAGPFSRAMSPGEARDGRGCGTRHRGDNGEAFRVRSSKTNGICWPVRGPKTNRLEHTWKGQKPHLPNGHKPTATPSFSFKQGSAKTMSFRKPMVTIQQRHYDCHFTSLDLWFSFVPPLNRHRSSPIRTYILLKRRRLGISTRFLGLAWRQLERTSSHFHD